MFEFGDFRPRDMFDLFIDRDVHEYLRFANKEKPRIFLVNAIPLMAEFSINYHKLTHALQIVRSVVARDEFPWRTQVEEDWSCSDLQVRGETNLREAKWATRAAMIILAFDVAVGAKERDPSIVYRRMRILPSTYYVDGFTTATLDHLRSNI